VQGVAEDVLQQVSNLHLPAGAQVSPGINSSQGEDVLSQLYSTLLFALPLVFIIMVATFRSLLQPLILLISIPFAAMGSIVLAAITQTPIGISSLLGALMLIGIVVTNAIVLIDRVNQYRAQGMDPRSAVIAGGRDRVRPILMTALATIMALIPTALGLGGSTSNFLLSSALSITVIGGLTSSTLLTLLLVPTLYVIVETTREHFTKKVAPVVPVKEEVLAALPNGTRKGEVLATLPVVPVKEEVLAALPVVPVKEEVLAALPSGTTRGNGLITRYGGTGNSNKLIALKKIRLTNAEGETTQV
jgi:HAE1 family hydrophobic/amphiphilic exporter-1